MNAYRDTCDACMRRKFERETAVIKSPMMDVLHSICNSWQFAAMSLCIVIEALMWLAGPPDEHNGHWTWKFFAAMALTDIGLLLIARLCQLIGRHVQ